MNNNDYKKGGLPGNAPLAMAYVPMQTSAMPAYDSAKALARGTLFPGLDLPFMGMTNMPGENTPLHEVMAIDFVTDELELYLDTHRDDAEAFEMYQTFLTLKKEAHSRYTAKFGPICQEDMLEAKKYNWLSDPWPWDYCVRED